MRIRERMMNAEDMTEEEKIRFSDELMAQQVRDFNQKSLDEYHRWVAQQQMLIDQINASRRS